MLATVLTLILLMTWQIPAAAIGLYLVFMVSRDSPAVSLRGGILSMLTLSAAVGAVLGVVGLTDNEPTARVVSVGAVGFVVGMVMRATTLSGPSVITSNPAICDHFKTGQRSRAQDMKLFYRGSASLGKFFSISL